MHLAQEYAPGLLVYRFGHSMYYANVDLLGRQVNALARSAPELRWFVIDLDAVDDVDFTAGTALLALRKTLAAQGIELKFLRAAPPVLAQLRRYSAVPNEPAQAQVFTSLRDMRHQYEAGRREG